MSSFGMIVLCLAAAATLHMTNGQIGSWGNLWDGHVNQRSGQGNLWGGHGYQWGGHGNQWGGHSSGLWGSGNHDEEATTAVCAAVARDKKRKKPTIFFQATIKKTSNHWHRSGLKIDVELKIISGHYDELSLVLTNYGATDNSDGCTLGNLGYIVTGERQLHHFQTSNSNGVIGTFEDLKRGDKIEETFTDLPTRILEKTFGCGLALCTDVKRVSDEGSGWSWGWNARMKPDKFRCEGEIPICCHLGKSDGDSDGQRRVLGR